MAIKKTEKKVVKKGPAEKVSNGNFSVEIVVNGETFKATAKTFEAALEKILKNEAFPSFIKTKVVLNFVHGKNKRFRVFFPKQAGVLFRRLDVHPQEIGLLATRLGRELE